MTRTILVTIATVDETTLVTALSFGSKNNNVGTATITLEDPTGAYLPSKGDAVEIKLDGTVRWAGEVTARTIRFLGENIGTQIVVTANDHNAYATRALVNTSYAQQGLKALLKTLTDPGGALHEYNVTLDPAQADPGPTVTAFDAPWWFVDKLLAYLSSITGWLWRIDENNVLSMWAIGTRSSGLTVSLAAGNLDTPEWTDHSFSYRNCQWVEYGPSGVVMDVTDAWTGDGVTQVFPLHYTLAGSIRTLDYGGVNHNTGIYGVDPMEWTYRASDNALVQDPGATPVGNGVAMSSIIGTLFPNRAYYEDPVEVGLRGHWYAKDANEAITDYPTAVAWAQRLVAQNKGEPKLPTITTLEDTIDPGETVAVSLAEVQLSTTCFVDAVTVTCDKAGASVFTESSLSLLGGSERVRSNDDLWGQIITGESTGGSAGTSGGGGGGIVPSGGGRAYADLGGSLSNRLPATGWQPVFESRPKVLYAADYAGGVATVKTCRVTSDPGLPVQLRVSAWNGAAWVVLATGTTYAGADPMAAAACEDLTIVVADGARHRLEINYPDDSTLLGGFGYVE